MSELTVFIDEEHVLENHVEVTPYAGHAATIFKYSNSKYYQLKTYSRFSGSSGRLPTVHKSLNAAKNYFRKENAIVGAPNCIWKQTI